VPVRGGDRRAPIEPALSAEPARRAPPAATRVAAQQPAAPTPAVKRSAEPAIDPDLVAVTENDVVRVGTIAALARRISGRATQGTGYRSLVAGESETLNVVGHATELARALADMNHSVILVDWCPDSDGLAEATGLASAAGIAELLAGTATFEEVIKRLPGSDAHMMVFGHLDGDETTALDPDRLNLVFDALDEAYDHIVIAGRHEAARSLFESIEGRVDAGVTIADASQRTAVLKDPPGTYLGFEVADIDLIRYDRQQAAAQPAQRIIRAGHGLAAGPAG
jgi:Mrp family chromosome partitioning ATPase